MAALISAAAATSASAHVVADEACPKYSVDIAAFATCDGEQVARAERPSGSSNALAIPAAKRSHSARHMTAREAYVLLGDSADPAVLIDVRSSIEVALTGQPSPVRFHAPYQEPVLPLTWNHERQSWVMAANPNFGEQLMKRLFAQSLGPDTTLIFICSSGERSAQAADELADIGFERVVTVTDGFEGDLGPDGRRAMNGWKNAGLPWTARASSLPDRSN
jgi:rhodanese-related sulfurtransferase